MSKSYARPTLDIARDQIGNLLDRFAELTGYPPTLVAKLARGEPKFAKLYRTIDFGFRSYDTVNSRLSALWPADQPWPEGIPRQAPAEIEPEVLADLSARAEKARPKAEPDAAGKAEPLPEGAAWPDDIPRPAESVLSTNEVSHGQEA